MGPQLDKQDLSSPGLSVVRTGPGRWLPKLLELKGKSKFWCPLVSLCLAAWAKAIPSEQGPKLWEGTLAGLTTTVSAEGDLGWGL